MNTERKGTKLVGSFVSLKTELTVVASVCTSICLHLPIHDLRRCDVFCLRFRRMEKRQEPKTVLSHSV
jgi:hypothetical protein